MTFIKKYIIFIVIAIILVVLIVVKSLKNKPKDTSNNAEEVLNDLGITMSQEFYRESAQNLAHHLGTAYGWWNPKHYLENDEEVYNIMKDLTRAQFNIIKKLYNEVYAKGNDLSKDLVSFLDDNLYKKLIIR